MASRAINLRRGLPRSDRRTCVRPVALYVGLLLAGLAVPAAAENPGAKPACLGLAEAECRTATGCKWLNGFATHDGKLVPGYCRSAPVPSAMRRLKQPEEAH